MKISYNWLREFVDFPQKPNELGKILDHLGFGVDGITEIGARWTNVVVGRVVLCEHVENSVHLSHCEVDIGGDSTITVVCGAPNVAQGQIIPLAMVGAIMPDGFEIARRKLKGIESAGMICSEKELALSEDSSGIMVLPADLPLGKPVEDYIGKRDWVFDLEVTFNRPDCLCHLGIAREIAAYLRLPLNMPETTVDEDETPTSERVQIEINAPDRCPRYSARVMDGVEVKPSPLWMQERLRSVGLRPINNVVDVTNYVLMEVGHPLHAFDYHLVNDGKIIVRLAEDGEKFTTLDDKEHTLGADDLMIADPKRGIALAGVMGGQNSEIKDDTKDILLECAYFEPVGIRITSRDRAISTESSHRFERGVDAEATPYAVTRAAHLIQKLGGGKLYKGLADNYPKPWQSEKIDFRVARANKILATDLSGEDMAEYLTWLGCEVGDGDTKTVTPPTWRMHDLHREIDLIEEIARLYGYDKIGAAISSSVPLIPDPKREHERKMIDRFRTALVELGMMEAINVTLLPNGDEEIFETGNKWVALVNPLSDDMAKLRPSLCSGLLRSVARNIKSGRRDVRLFEWGSCFWQEQDNIVERLTLGGIVIGNRQPETWMDATREFGIYDLKGLLEQFTRKISLDKVRFISYHVPKSFQFGGAIFAGDQADEEPLGIYGCIDPYVAEKYEVDFPVWYFELNGNRLLELSGTTPQFKHLPRFPAALRDLAFVIDDNVGAGEIEDAIRRHGGEYLQDIEMFDMFRGKSIPEGKKSLAFHLMFRSSAQTLSDHEVDGYIEAIIEAVKQETGAVLRSI